MEKVIEIENLRARIDQLNEKLISGIATRIKYPLNKGVFEEEFFEGKSWFLYRLKKDQDLDAEFGRFLYNDQLPFIFKRDELENAKIADPENKGVRPVEIDSSKKIIGMYQEMLNELCENKEDKGTYGETTKMDVENVLTLNERTVGLGEQVAAYKVTNNPELKTLSSEEIRKELIKPEREKQVIEQTILIAKKYKIDNNKLMEKFARNLIDIALDAEVHFILNSR